VSRKTGNGVLRRIFGIKGYEITGLRQLYNEKYRNMYSSPNTIIMIKSRRMRWAEDVACMLENSYTVLIQKPEGMKTHYKDLDMNVMLILKWRSKE
jgi:hypothetical protein